MGSPLYRGHVPSQSAAVVEALERAGGFVLGKTVTAELAFYAPGKTRNPWNPAHTPGGSSMGSAAAVAGGMTPAALGTQTNGSVIRPAAFCGVVGYKPTAGLIARHGVLRFSETLDQLGVFTRSVADAARMAASAGNDAALAVGATTGRAPRLVAVRSPVWTRAETAQQALQVSAIARLRGAGAKVEERELPADFADAHAVHRTIMWYEGARALAPLQARDRSALSDATNALIDEGLAIGAADLAAALSARDQLQRALADFLSDGDAILTPPACGEAPATLANTGDPTFCTIWTLCGVPAIVLPSALGPQGLPLGIQLVGGAMRDSALLEVARWCEQVIGFSHRPREQLRRTP
jgi:Asp-tRNA(Asn)/Glu-tRNA(Gln) amidotransferase A subunit family amidase